MQSNQATLGAIISGVGSLASSVLSSDRRAKTHIHSAKRDVRGFLDALGVKAPQRISFGG